MKKHWIRIPDYWQDENNIQIDEIDFIELEIPSGKKQMFKVLDYSMKPKMVYDKIKVRRIPELELEILKRNNNE